MDDKPPVQGKCLTMCPEKEITMRERKGLVHVFESRAGSDNGSRARLRADHNKMVKEYTRPAAGKADPDPHDLRPPDVLYRTVCYLVNSILPRTDHPWTTVYEYVFDRLRAVRQDLVIQQWQGVEAVQILEMTVRFHIYAGYRLCTSPPGKASYDAAINTSQVHQCLTHLLNLYRRGSCCHDNRAEFESLYLMYNLGNTEALVHGLDVWRSLRQDHQFKTALQTSMAFMLGNYVRVSHLLKGQDALSLCAVHRHLLHLQRQGLHKMSCGFNSKNLKFPLERLCHLLCFDNDMDTADTCGAYGLTVANGAVVFLRANFNTNTEVPPRHYKLIEDKLKSVHISDLVRGAQTEGNPDR